MASSGKDERGVGRRPAGQTERKRYRAKTRQDKVAVKMKMMRRASTTSNEAAGEYCALQKYHLGDAKRSAENGS